jgi:hypothetical protein
MRKTIQNNNHYEFVTKDMMFVTPVIRSIKDVMIERMKVAHWFEPNDEKADVLTGSCSLFKSSIKIVGQNLVIAEPKELPVNLHLQDMIDVYNTLTAEDVIKMYNDSKKKPSRRKQQSL